jgi:AcrR family transcriptional regulator
MPSKKTETPPRVRLNRERVLRAAVDLADRGRIESVSMRILADVLGVVPMALYKHVANKDELLEGMVDMILSEIESPDSGVGWAEAVRQRILAARRTLLVHPWARQVIESCTTRTPAVLTYMDALAGAFITGGFSADLTHHVMHTLGNRMWGFSPELFNPSPTGDPLVVDTETRDAMLREIATVYPNIALITRETLGNPARTTDGCDEQFEFEFALDLLLDAFDRLHHQGWSSTPKRRAHRTKKPRTRQD